MADNERSIYVGYLDMPAAHRSLIRKLVPGLLFALVVLGVAITLGQRDPGPGMWDLNTARAFEGILVVDPYPMLRVEGDDIGSVRTLMIVDEAKSGVRDRVETSADSFVRIKGTLLERGTQGMIAMSPDFDAVLSVSPSYEGGDEPLRNPARESLGTVTLQGEIVDYKCYVGGMKPGDGKAHKACATLCIAGGVPPVLIAPDATGTAVPYLLAAPDGGPLDNWILPFVADAIEVTGELERIGDMRILSVSSDVVRRR